MNLAPAIPQQWNLLDNRVVVVSFLAWLIAQVIKVIINSTQHRRLEWHYLISTGSMPSAHCALVSALTTSVGLTQGLDSVLFAITAVLAMIVVYDAGGVRRTVGIQSTVINRMLEEVFKANSIVKERLKEFIGHSRWEVVAGVCLGILTGWVGSLGVPWA